MAGTFAHGRRTGPHRAASALLALSACAAAIQAKPLPERQAIAITEVTIIDVEKQRSIGPRTVLIEDGRIVAIVAPRDAHVPANAQRVAGRGRFLIPGLVDMHVHLFNNTSRRPPNNWSFPLYATPRRRGRSMIGRTPDSATPPGR